MLPASVRGTGQPRSKPASPLVGWAVVGGFLALIVVVIALSHNSGAGAESDSLNRDRACAEFFDILMDYTMTDEESANEFGSLAARTEDPALAGEIQNVATGFALHRDDIPTTPVTDLCPLNTGG